MMKHRLWPILIAGAAVLVALNLGLSARSHRLPYRTKLEAIRTAQHPNLLFVGNSLLDQRVDAAAVSQTAARAGRQYSVLNAALGATEPPEQRLLFGYAMQEHPEINTLVVGVFDFQLTKEDHSGVSDLGGNRMIGVDRRFPLADVASAYHFGPTQQINLRFVRAVPMAANRLNIWQYVEVLRRKMGSMGMPPSAANSMGRVSDFASLEASSESGFDREANSFIDNPEHFNTSFEAIFKEARRRKMEVVIVLMPMSPVHRNLFYSRASWRAYLTALGRLADQRGIHLVDASAWFLPEDDFADHLHMTETAAHLFSIQIAQTLCSLSGDQQRGPFLGESR